jgi:hypothetical protein
MKLCDLCGSLEIVVDDGDVQLCQKCKEEIEKTKDYQKLKVKVK